MNFTELSEDEFPVYYSHYIKDFSDENLFEELEISLHQFIKFVQEISIFNHDYRYAPGKWTIKEIIQHLIDSERIFAYRALRFSRNDTTVLPGFDENFFVENSFGQDRHLKDLLEELSLVRFSNIKLFKSFTKEMLLNKGIASNQEVSVRALGFMIIGHQNHHKKIYQERYLNTSL